MPTANLSPEARRELTLRALRGESPKQLADEYGVHRTLIYYYIQKTKESAESEKAFWDEVVRFTR